MNPRRRILPGPPRLVGRPPNQYAQELQDYLAAVTNAQDAGAPVPHVGTHLVGGSDALPAPGSPSAIAASGATGDGPAFAYEDHVHALTLAVVKAILGMTTKGDLLGHGASTLARVPVGVDGQALIANPASGVGVSYGAPYRGAQIRELVNGVATPLLTLALPDDFASSLVLRYHVSAAAGAAVQAEAGVVSAAMVSEAGTIAVSTPTLAAVSQVLPSSTLTVSFDVDIGVEEVTLRCTATSGLVAPEVNMLFFVDVLADDDQTVTFF